MILSKSDRLHTHGKKISLKNINEVVNTSKLLTESTITLKIIHGDQIRLSVMQVYLSNKKTLRGVTQCLLITGRVQ